MDWGGTYATIVAAARSAGFPLSELPCVAKQVEPFEHLLFEWLAFGELKTDRQIGMDLGPIPWSSIDRYASRYGVVGDDFDRLCSLIRAMDHTFLAYLKEKNGNAQR
jgi:hypothetical protein